MLKRSATASLLALCLTISSGLHAEEAWDWDALSRAPSLLFLESRIAEGGVLDLYAGLDLSIFNEGRALIYINQSEAIDKHDNVTEAFGFSLSSATDQLVSLSMGVDYLNQEEAIEIDAYHLTVLLSPGNWQFSLSAELRRILLFPNPWVQRFRPDIQLSTETQGTTIGLGYYGWDDWAVSIYYRQDRYGNNLKALALQPRWSQLVFTQAGLNAAWNLTKRQQGLSLSHYFENSYLTAFYDKSWSAVDDQAFFYLALRFGYELNNEWSVEIEGGDGFAETAKKTSNTYAALAVIRSW